MIPMKRTQAHDESGFTLIEVMIAILLAAIAALGMMGLFRVQSKAAGFTRRETEAAELAQDKLEMLRTEAVATTTTTTTETGLDADGGTGGPFTRTSVQTVSGDIVKFQVTVDWDDGTAVRSVVVHGVRGGS